MAETAALVLGRATYDVAAVFDSWPYGELPVFVVTSRPLPAAPATVARSPAHRPSSSTRFAPAPTARSISTAASLIRRSSTPSLIDELTVTIVNVILGDGVPLFAGVADRRRLRLTGATPYPSGLVQLRYAA